MGYEYHKRGLRVLNASSFNAAVTVKKTLTASSNATLTKTASLSSNATVSGTLGVTKTLTASSNSTLTKTASFSSNASVTGTLGVTKTLTASSNMTATKTLTESSTLKFGPVNTGTTAANFPRHGITAFGATGAKTYKMTAPIAGAIKILYCTNGATGAIQKVAASTSNSVNIISTNGSKNIIQFNKTGQIAYLFGYSTVAWTIQRGSGFTFSTA